MTLLLIYLTVAIGVSFLCSILEAVLLISNTKLCCTSTKKISRVGGKVLAKCKRLTLISQYRQYFDIEYVCSHYGRGGCWCAGYSSVFGESKRNVNCILINTWRFCIFQKLFLKLLGATFWRSASGSICLYHQLLSESGLSSCIGYRLY